MSDVRTIGILAGKGIYPKTFVDAARRQSEEIRLVLVAFDGETDELLAELVDEVAWFKVGQLGKISKFLQSQGATEAIMVGQITPRNLFEFQPDLRMLGLMSRLPKKNAESIFGGIADELSKDGITVISALTFLEDQMAPEGHFAGPKPTEVQLADAEYGLEIAKESSRLDIGQSVVVREGTVLAVEAFEGTNKCIQRGGELGKGKNCLLAKVSKPNQDLRFDVPVIGPDTIENCQEAGVKAIAVESGKTLVLDRVQLENLAKKFKICVIGQ